MVLTSQALSSSFGARTARLDGGGRGRDSTLLFWVVPRFDALCCPITAVEARELMGGERVMVLSVWEPFIDVLARTVLGVGAGVIGFEALDNAYEESACERAAEARRAPGVPDSTLRRTRGLNTPRSRQRFSRRLRRRGRARLCLAPADSPASSHCFLAASRMPSSSAPVGGRSLFRPLRWCTSVRPTVAEKIPPWQ